MKLIAIISLLVLFMITLLVEPASGQTIRRDNTFSKKISIGSRTTPVDTSGTTRPATPEDPAIVTGSVERERLGPSNITFGLANQVQADVDFTGRELLNVFNTIYRDKNSHSGYYYYLPAAYNLSWSAGTGEYEFSASYSAANEDGRGETTVTAILKPKLGGNELKLVKELLKKSIEGKPEQQYGIAEIAPMPMAQAPEIAFSNLGQFDVAAQDISIRAPSDLMDPIYISFTTSRIDDLMGMFFNNIGLYGDVIIYPDGEGMPATIRIPFNLKIDDPGTYGRFELTPGSWRNGWQNQADYPVVLSRFNVLKKELDGRFKVYTWQMGDKEIPEHAKVSFDGNLVPRWIDSNPNIERIWLDYTVKPCVSCNGTIKEKIIKGTSGSRVQQIGFTVLTPLEFTKAGMMKIRVRSYQADPNGRSKLSLPTLTVTQDGTTHPGGQLFIPEGGTPDFEYMIQLYMADGTKHESEAWQQSHDLEVVIGTTQIQNMINHFK